MFDLPTCTAEERKQATKFRTHLLDLGFEMAQFSVYMKYCSSGEKAESINKKVMPELPLGGKVDVLTVTDKQFADMKRYYGGTETKNGPKPKQLHIF